MSTETLNSIKTRAETLSSSEKKALAAYLLETASDEQNEKPKITIDTVVRRKRQAWIRANRSRYGGLYVALDGDRLLATGHSYAEAFDAAAKPDAFVDFVPPEDYVGETGGWE
jgi:hypothetical protein